jgi:hypothetical protein
VAAIHVEGHLVDVVRVHVPLVIAAAKVKHGEEPCTTELIHHRNQEFVLHRTLVQLMVVDAKVSCVIVFLHQEHQGGKYRGALLNDALV